MEIPVQWHQGAVFLMNQRTAGLLMTMSDAIGRPLLQSMQGIQDSPRWSLLGFPIYLVSQMPNVGAGATPILFGNLKQTYTVVTRQNPTIELDQFSAGFCVLFKAQARVGGAVTCGNASRLLRIR
jgi:HK97 family phage major capsid protein